MTQNTKNTVRNIIYIFVGCLLYAIGVGLFLDPNELTPGGIAGLAIALNRLLDILFDINSVETGTIIAAVNIPIMLLGMWKLGFKFFFSTIVATILSSWFINILQAYVPVLTTEPMLASILGGATMSLGMGIIFKAGATTGGSDVIVRVLRTKFKNIRTGEMFWLIDGTSVLISTLVFGKIEVALYAVFTLTVQTVVINKVLYGSDSATMVYIISDKEKEISERLSTELKTGLTLMKAQDSVSKEGKNVVMCVIKKKTLAKLKELVAETDQKAFMIVTKATEIFGRGFKDHNSEEI